MKLRESQVLRLQRLYPGTIVKQTVDTVLVPRPKTARIGGTPLRDTDLLTWAAGLLDAVLGDSVPAAASAGT
jgi:transcription-repair coupling factor (superfamily II helicase)